MPTIVLCLHAKQENGIVQFNRGAKQAHLSFYWNTEKKDTANECKDDSNRDKSDAVIYLFVFTELIGTRL